MSDYHVGFIVGQLIGILNGLFIAAVINGAFFSSKRR